MNIFSYQYGTVFTGKQIKEFLKEWESKGCSMYGLRQYERCVDDELYDFLNQLRAKVGDKGKIIVVSDACHSGSGSRGDEDDVVRGVQEKFEMPAERNAGSVKRESTAWLFVSACKAYQNNFEYRDTQGNYHGMLSYLLWENRAAMSHATWQEVMATIDNRMLYIAKYPQQSQREGAPNSIDEKLF